MFPSLAPNNMVNRRPLKIELGHEALNAALSARAVLLSNCSHGIFGNTRVWIARAVQASPFIDHVLHVFHIGPEKEVVRPNAVSDIAAVTHVEISDLEFNQGMLLDFNEQQQREIERLEAYETQLSLRLFYAEHPELKEEEWPSIVL